jgi:hypothetical protein
VGAISAVGGGVRGLWQRSSSYSDPVAPSVDTLEMDDVKEGHSRSGSDSELLGGVVTGTSEFAGFIIG